MRSSATRTRTPKWRSMPPPPRNGWCTPCAHVRHDDHGKPQKDVNPLLPHERTGKKLLGLSFSISFLSARPHRSCWSHDTDLVQPDLIFIQSPINAVFECDKFSMRAAFDNSTFLEYKDDICLTNRGKSMGDNESRTAPH